MTIDANLLLLSLLGLQALTALAWFCVARTNNRLVDGLKRLEPVVIAPRPTGNPTINLYDSAAYFVEWCQANNHTGEIKFSDLWVLYQKYCVMRDLPEADWLAQPALAGRLAQLLGDAKTLSDTTNGKRRRLQVYCVPCLVEHCVDKALDGKMMNEISAPNVTNFRKTAA